MKKYFLTLLSVWAICSTLSAQNKLGKSDDAGRLALASVVPSQIEGLTPSVESTLLNKLNQITSKFGMGASPYVNRFILTTNVVVLTKDITPTAPPMHAYTLEITFYIGDGIDGTLFSSMSQTLKGVGETETRAYMSALKNIKTDDPKFKIFIDKGKDKIIEYYNSTCDLILKEADMLTGKNEFDAAITKLSSIPSVCKDCYDKAMSAVQPIYQKKINLECKKQMNEAQAIWSSTQDVDGAKSASSILSQINPNSSCAREAEGMISMIYNDIQKRVKQLDAREWNYVMKEQAQESERIEAIRAIGVAYGNNQPQNITYNYRGWW